MNHEEGMETAATTSTTALAVFLVIVGLMAFGGLALIAMAAARILQ